ncbi:hypothetical protein J1N35_025206 [Gossypium stocksii]|uniref:Aminotransferase-like plant mobile domain-containing protein n=1 Tax=Gossypium stocksii TaxID=47602 RepID=A0A9D3V796_9ROSI|nr:hypothetical protein J1N35_025206 [Gossypium stocksii]
MVAFLIRFDDKHISVAQLVMGFIHNIEKYAIVEIRGLLQAGGFLHASSMSRGCKLGLQLISTLVERWRLKTHTFHSPCGECTITLEDAALQLCLLVDRPIITGSEIILNKVPNKFEGDRISMNWLKDNFDELSEDRTEEVIQQYDRAYTMRLIGGILMPDKSKILMHETKLRSCRIVHVISRDVSGYEPEVDVDRW